MDNWIVGQNAAACLLPFNRPIQQSINPIFLLRPRFNALTNRGEGQHAKNFRHRALLQRGNCPARTY
jgi:hypothetical protein